MTSVSVSGGRALRGRLRVPGDKSISHRALLLAALAEGTSRLRGLSTGEDVARTAAAIGALGAEVDGERVSGGVRRLHEPVSVIDVGNSGTTIRLLAGLCSGFDWLTVLTGDASIARRPMDRVTEPLRAMGAAVDGRDGGRLPPLVVRGGGLKAIDYTPPAASAQVKAAVLLAALRAEGETVLREPRPTRAHTEEMLATCGADIDVVDDQQGRVVRLRPSSLEPLDLDVPGDPSQAAFWVVAACIVSGSELVVDDVYLGPGRAGFLDVLARMGADVERVGESGLRAGYSPGLHGTEVGEDEVPGLIDEVPILAVAASVAEGPTSFRGVAELRVKESDRITAMAEGLRAFGAEVETTADDMVFAGGARLRGAQVQPNGDHRIAMAFAVAGLAADGQSTIDGWEAVATSYPGFEDQLKACLC